MSDEILSPYDALIYIMVLVSAADNDMTDRELQRIGDVVRTMPVFADFDENDLIPTAQQCAELLGRDNGLERVLDKIVASLPARLAETAYAVACDIAAVDLHVEAEEARLLQMLRDRLDIDRLIAAAIERGARARHITL
jgi:tellurite resistance protein